MIYNFISLIYQSNIDLMERNKKYGDIIVDIEVNTKKLFEDYFDYSGIFRDSLDDMYEQVKNFSGEFFDELIQMINVVYDKYTNI